MSPPWAGRGAGVDSSTGVRPALRADSRLAPSATTPDGRQVVSAQLGSAPASRWLPRRGWHRPGSFSKLPASAMRLASAALRRSGSALCRTTRIAYRVALLKSRARDSVFILVWDGGRARERARSAGAHVGMITRRGGFLPTLPREIGVFSAVGARPRRSASSGPSRSGRARQAPSEGRRRGGEWSTLPRVAGDDAVQDGVFRRRFLQVRREVAQALELPGRARRRHGARFHQAVTVCLEFGSGRSEILVAAVRTGVGEQAVIQMDLRGHGMRGADPGDVARP